VLPTFGPQSNTWGWVGQGSLRSQRDRRYSFTGILSRRWGSSENCENPLLLLVVEPAAQIGFETSPRAMAFFVAAGGDVRSGIFDCFVDSGAI